MNEAITILGLKRKADCMKLYHLAVTASESTMLKKALNYVLGMPDINEDENAELKNTAEAIIDELTTMEEVGCNE